MHIMAFKSKTRAWLFASKRFMHSFFQNRNLLVCTWIKYLCEISTCTYPSHMLARQTEKMFSQLGTYGPGCKWACFPSANTALAQVNAESSAGNIQASWVHISGASSCYHWNDFEIGRIKLRALETSAWALSNFMKELKPTNSENKES